MKVKVVAKSDAALKEILEHYSKQGFKKRMLYNKLGIEESFVDKSLIIDFTKSQLKTRAKILRKKGVNVDYSDLRVKKSMQIKIDDFKISVHDQMRKAGVCKEEYEVNQID